ncbi:MAG TPA: hypothetical protein VF179_14425 [Thermoanaerobaculia bacterium]|nr:hypothetical protein [Thermoanaerobaculia bacterium]
MKRIVAAFISILSAAALLVWLLLTHGNKQAQELGKELGKLTGQVTLVAVLGGIIVQEYNRRRERSEAVNEFRKTVLRNLIHAYAGAKKSRRLLRARCRLRNQLQGDDIRIEIPRLVYEEQMGSVNEIQLELEMLVHELNTFSDAFSTRNLIRGSVHKMQKYLGTIITEYEKSLRETEDSECIPLDKLVQLSDFVDVRKDSYFRRNFTGSFYSALSLIQKERLRVS